MTPPAIPTNKDLSRALQDSASEILMVRNYLESRGALGLACILEQATVWIREVINGLEAQDPQAAGPPPAFLICDIFVDRHGEEWNLVALTDVAGRKGALLHGPQLKAIWADNLKKFLDTGKWRKKEVT